MFLMLEKRTVMYIVAEIRPFLRAVTRHGCLTNNVIVSIDCVMPIRLQVYTFVVAASLSSTYF